MFLLGVAILSKYPIKFNRTIHLTRTLRRDSNDRVCLHAQVELPSAQLIDVIAVHLSYDRLEQCNNVAQLQRYIAGEK